MKDGATGLPQGGSRSGAGVLECRRPVYHDGMAARVVRLACLFAAAGAAGLACSLVSGGLWSEDDAGSDGVADAAEATDSGPDVDARDDGASEVDAPVDAPVDVDVDVGPDGEPDVPDDVDADADEPPDAPDADAEVLEAAPDVLDGDVAEDAADEGSETSCPSDCSGHGTCVAGTCICHAGYATPACDRCAAGYAGYPTCVLCGTPALPCCDGDVCSTSGWECVAGTCSLACPGDMIRIGDTGVCIDRYEASRSGAMAVSVAGAAPWRNVHRWNAETGCVAAGKRLCTGAEWQSACRGPAGNPYPYGPAFTSGICNDRNGTVCRRDGTGVVATGSYPLCQGGYPGIYDLSGNVWEWVWDYTGNCGLVGGSVDCCGDAACLACAPLSWQDCGLEWPGLGFRCCLTR